MQLRDWDELGDLTVWDITTNGSVLELIVLGLVCLMLSVMYFFINAWYKVKYLGR